MTPTQACPLRTQCSNTSAVTNQSGFDPTIPVVDIRLFENTATRKQFLLDLEKALEKGFFGVVGLPVDSEKLQKGYEAIHKFFSSPMEQKQTINGKATFNQRGFIPGEIALGETEPDPKEFLHIGPTNNIWPTFLDLKAPTTGLYDELSNAALPLLNAISLLLGQREDYLLNLETGADVMMRCSHYLPNPKDGVWGAAHTDLNLLTILPRASGKGLEVMLDGKWTPVVVPEGAFIVNVADLLEILSNGRWKSCIHRVVCTEPDTARESIVHFITTRDNEVLRPLGIDKAKFPPVTRMEFLKLRIFSLGYLDGNETEQKKVQKGTFVKELKKLVSSGDAVEPVKRWYAGFQNTVSALEAKKVRALDSEKGVSGVAHRATAAFKDLFSRKVASAA